MFYKRPSLRRGGMPTGIDTLSPRVQANKGFFGQTPLFFRDSKQIGLDFPPTMTSMQMPTAFQERVMMKSFPMDASEMGVASVVKPTKETVSINEDIGSEVLDSDFDTTERVDGKIVTKPYKGFLGYEEGIDTTTIEFIKGLTEPGQSEGYIEAK